MNVRVLHWKVEWEKFTCYSHIALNVALNFARIYVLLVAVHTLWLVFFFSTLCRHAFLCLLFFLARFFFIFALCMSFAQQSLHKINSTVDSSWNCCCSCVVVERRKNHRFFIVSLLWLLFLFLFLNCFFFALKEGIPANSHYWHTFYSIGCFKSPRKIENSFKAGKKTQKSVVEIPLSLLTDFEALSTIAKFWFK